MVVVLIMMKMRTILTVLTFNRKYKKTEGWASEIALPPTGRNPKLHIHPPAIQCDWPEDVCLCGGTQLSFNT